MIDLHMHVLPAMDDGSKNIFISLAMLEKSAAYGIEAVAATPHFYAEDNSPERFLARRQQAYERLVRAGEGEPWMPRLLLGAEVRFFGGIGAMKDLDKLCLEGTNFLLLEMPFIKWTDRMLREVDEISDRGLQVIAAHVERYFSIQPDKTMRQFLEKDIFVQSNAEFFLERKTERKALSMLKKQKIHFLGSDAHNITSRPPNLGAARALIQRKLGADALQHLETYEGLISGARGRKDQ